MPELKMNMNFRSCFAKIANIILNRCARVDKHEEKSTREMLEEIKNTWLKGFQHYGDAGNFGILKREERPLMYALSAEIPDRIKGGKGSFPTPTSNAERRF